MIRRTPTLTPEQLLHLKQGDCVRNIHGTLFHVVAFVDGKAGESLAVLGLWSRRHCGWRYEIVDYVQMGILYTPATADACAYNAEG